MLKKCANCGTEFDVVRHHVNLRTNCSRKCHYEYRRNGGYKKPFDLAKFWAQVDKSGDCWLWMGSLHTQGYGLAGDKGAHRVSWELHNGLIPNGMHVLHECDANYPAGDISYRRCIKPDHLFLGTHIENIKDMYAKGRDSKFMAAWHRSKTHCAHGHAYSEDNTYVTRLGHRQCRTCKRRAVRLYKERRRNAAKRQPEENPEERRAAATAIARGLR